MANHETDKANALAGEGAEFVGNFEAAVADDRAEELAEFEIGHAGGRGRTRREEGAGVAAEGFPASGGAGPGDFSRSGRSVATVGGKSGDERWDERARDQNEQLKAHARRLESMCGDSKATGRQSGDDFGGHKKTPLR